MTWRTHLAGGMASLALLLPVIQETDAGLLVLFAAFGSLLPDLDARESRIKHLSFGLPVKPFLLPSLLLNRMLGHRGLLHSLAGLLLAALAIGFPVSLWLGIGPMLAFLLGYASHLFLDAMTKAGIPLFYPNLRRFHLLPPRLRITTGSVAEDALTACCAVFALLTLLRFLAVSRPETLPLTLSL